MKIKGYHNHNLVKAVQITTLFGLIPSIILLYGYGTPIDYIIALTAIILIGKLGHSAGQHRYFCHRSFNTDNKRQWALGLLATLCTTNSALYYAAVHRYHHKVSDSERDPHSPRRQGLFRSFLGFVDKSNTEGIPGKIIADLLKNKPAMFFHNWYWPTIILYWLVLIIINPFLLIVAYIIPVGYVQFVNGTQTFFGHKWGYTNYDTKDDSRNNIWWNILTLGEGLHNNHHERPWEYDFAWDRRSGEWDFTGWLIRKTLVKD